MDNNDSKTTSTDASLGAEVIKTVTLTAAATAGMALGMVIIGTGYAAIEKVKDLRVTKKTANEKK